MRIDFHTHVFPEPIAQKAISSLEETGGVKAAYPGTIPALLGAMKESGVGLSVVMPIVTRPSQTASILRFARQVNETPGLRSFGSVHPLSPTMKEDVRAVFEAGLPGIKLHPDFQGVFIDDDAAVRTMQEAASQGLLILLHAGEDLSYSETHHCTPARLARVLDRLKDAKIICAHTGGWHYWDDVERLLMDAENVYIDTSFTYRWCDPAQMRRILLGFDPDRILFGSDSPWEHPGESAEDLKKLDLPEELYEKIFFKNAMRLLGM